MLQPLILGRLQRLERPLIRSKGPLVQELLLLFECRDLPQQLQRFGSLGVLRQALQFELCGTDVVTRGLSRDSHRRRRGDAVS